MSQRIYHLETENRSHRYQVMTGWDRPLGTYFLSIEDLNPPASEEEEETQAYLLCTLTRLTRRLTLSDLLELVESLELPLPDELATSLFFDGQIGLGSYREEYPSLTIPAPLDPVRLASVA